MPTASRRAGRIVGIGANIIIQAGHHHPSVRQKGRRHAKARCETEV